MYMPQFSQSLIIWHLDFHCLGITDSSGMNIPIHTYSYTWLFPQFKRVMFWSEGFHYFIHSLTTVVGSKQPQTNSEWRGMSAVCQSLDYGNLIESILNIFHLNKEVFKYFHISYVMTTHLFLILIDHCYILTVPYSIKQCLVLITITIKVSKCYVTRYFYIRRVLKISNWKKSRGFSSLKHKQIITEHTT